VAFIGDAEMVEGDRLAYWKWEETATTGREKVRWPVGCGHLSLVEII